MTDESGKQSGTDGAQASEAPPVGTESLDSLLKQWGESSSATPEAGNVVGRVLKKIEPALEFVNEEKTKRQVESQQKDLNSALEFMLEPDEYKDFPKRWMRGYLEGYSSENASFSEAFANRADNPQGWQSALAQARESFADWVKELPGSKIRSDVEAAKAAVNGTSTEPAEDPDKSEQELATELMDMSESDYQKYVRQQIAKAEAAG